MQRVARFLTRFALAATLATPALAQSAVEVGGFGRFYASIGLSDDLPYRVLRFRSRLDVRSSFDSGRFFASQDVRTELDATRPKGYRLEWQPRELFVDLYRRRLDLRIGLQQIVWGEADGAFVTDVLSPLDLREFLTLDVSDLRLGLPAANLTLYSRGFRTTLVVVPYPLPTLLPDAESIWSPLPDGIGEIPVDLLPTELPRLRLSSGEIAARITLEGLPRTGVSFLVVNGYHRIPAFRKRASLLPGGAVRLSVTPFYYRRWLAGASFETALTDPFVIRGEVAVQDRNLVDLRIGPETPLEDLVGAPEGWIVSRVSAQGMTSLERKLGNHLLRVQWLGQWLFGDSAEILRDRFEYGVTGIWLGRFRRDLLQTTVFVFVAGERSGWLHARASYAVSDGLNAAVGVHLFGSRDSDPTGSPFSFSPFETNDLAYARLQYTF